MEELASGEAVKKEKKKNSRGSNVPGKVQMEKQQQIPEAEL